jgi:hypothetical protein
LSKPLASRFRKLFLSKYSESQFLEEFSEKVLPKLSSAVARYIGKQMWDSGGDIRDVIAAAKLVRRSDGPDEIAGIISTIFKYGAEAD